MMIVKISGIEYNFDGYVHPINSIQKLAEEIYQQGIEDERPKAFAKGYDSGYQQGRADALDHCEKCETEQWDALYKAEMKGRADAIEEIETKLYECGFIWTEHAEKVWKDIREQLKEQK